ncbi:radical SAM/SPASM protein FxsBH, inactivated beta-hydroxylase extension form [Streptomyces cylindrosporus]|uniref:Radical SAM/SPASM protein FxsB, inactivated metallohydrolase extension form n=1 Tax=Streptomyces cylindrosporus TaxID=2927583 RepID=A0ABS9XY58_9ACTN|nr:radical SAM/SPASM protein FxsB, inactivated metallohydrolase extension form [Streptomyces cylindrosporus]MCI3269892.1 radical SAM/SPASM protein FxsB, inactivated metallohydrolase extension form [Streptomyces cylindrosporus]
MTDSSIQQVVLKIHSRCDLACDHCYVYEHADQSWRARPVRISEETVELVARRLADYAHSRGLDSVSVILHGGEPLLVGPAQLRRICAELTRTLSPVTTLDLRIHTNGVTLNAAHLEVFREFGVKVSISLDGDQAANDRHRLDRRGRSSHERVLRAIGLLRRPENRHLWSGLLCTVDVANDPVAVHDALTALDPPRIDYLLPHSTWEHPPPSGPSSSPTPYADWLLAVFDRWERQGRRVPVRTFDSVLSTLRGGPSLTEAMGLAPSDLAVVETDGSFEQADSLKTAFAGAPATGYHVRDHGFAEFAEHPGVRARQSGVLGVSETCRSCPVLESCGGGLYAHRYSPERGFDNPSVFCRDLRALVEGVAERVTDHSLSAAVCGPVQLRFAQVELDRLLLARVHAELAGDPAADLAWRLLGRLDAEPAAQSRLNALLTHPYLRTSLLSSLRGPVDTPRFLSVAAAAAVHAGAEVSLAWEQPGRRLYLPTLGTLSLSKPGRVEVEVGADGFRVWDGTGRVSLPSARPAEWRPLATVAVEGGPELLVDDADPYRECFPAEATPPLEPADLALFRKRLLRTAELLEERFPAWRDGPYAGTVTTITPLVAGAGVRPGADHGLGALGVAVDVEPEELVLALPGLARRARLTALRQTADLNAPGSAAGLFLDRVGELLGAGDHEAAARALTALTLRPEHELTATGAVLAAQMWNEWAQGRG